MSEKDQRKCTFCGEVKKPNEMMIQSPDGEANICSDCATGCAEMFREHCSQELIELPTPEQIHKLLDEYEEKLLLFEKYQKSLLLCRFFKSIC